MWDKMILHKYQFCLNIYLHIVTHTQTDMDKEKHQRGKSILFCLFSL